MAPSRLSRKKQKGDKALNWAIGVVSALILIIGGIILISLLKSPGSQNTASDSTSQHQQDATHSKKSNKNGDSSGGHMASNSSSDSSSNSGSNGNSNADSNSNTSSSDNGQATDDNSNSSSSSSAATSENVPDSKHTASYKQGSADWNAQVAALSQATGIPQDQMTLWWLGNGGSPNASIGRVSSKKTPDQKYVVKLVYKDKHWQAADVQKP